jgi:peptidyl-prolyl cis-trans isomerase D
MIARMRDIAPVVMWVVIITFVGTIFFAWGMDFAGLGNKNLAGKIDGKQIPLDYFDRAVNQERERMQQRYAGTEVPAYQYSIVPKQVWEQEVSRFLAEKTFSHMYLAATADEIFEYLKKNPPPGIDTASYFQTAGTFDTSKYIAFLNNPASYDNPGLRELETYTQKNVIPMLKLGALLRGGSQPSHAEVAREYRASNERALFAYAFAPMTSFPVDSGSITAGQISGYYAAHRDSFKTDERAELYFMAIPKKATPGDDIVYRDEMVEIRNKILSKEISFADEAKQESDDQGSAEKGGDLGWFGRGTMVPAFDSAAFALDTGVLSQPVRTSFGYHLIQVQAREKKGDTVRVKARHILRKIYPTMETLDSLKELADSLRDHAMNEGFAAAALKDKSVRFDSTGLFKKGDVIPGIGYLTGLSKFAFSSEAGSINEEPLENKEAYFIFQLKRRVGKGYISLEDAHARILRTLMDSLSMEKARAHLAAVLANSGSGDSLALLSKKDPLLQTGMSDTITRKGFVPGLGAENDAIAAAFAVPLNTVSGVIAIPAGYGAVRPAWRHTIDVIPWGTYPVIAARQSLMQNDAQAIMNQWFIAEEKKMKVESFIDKFYSQ